MLIGQISYDCQYPVVLEWRDRVRDGAMSLRYPA